MKVSFDFDGVLDNIHIQRFAKELMNMGIDIHVTTSNPNPNKDPIFTNFTMHHVYKLTDKLGIDRENIHFTDFSPKYIYFIMNGDFTFHLDDDENEVREINSYTKVKAIFFDESWKDKCLEAVKI
jgi:hypothetical protein